MKICLEHGCTYQEYSELKHDTFQASIKFQLQIQMISELETNLSICFPCLQITEGLKISCNTSLFVSNYE